MAPRSSQPPQCHREQHYEVPPCSQRVAWLNGQHLKPMLAFEALTKALGWAYNYHKPQVAWQCDCSVRLEVAKVRRVRGHTSHPHPATLPHIFNTHVQVGTYLTFHLERYSSIAKCCLVLDGLEAVHKTSEDVTQRDKNTITLTRVNTSTVHDQQPEDNTGVQSPSSSCQSPGKLSRQATKQKSKLRSRNKSRKLRQQTLKNSSAAALGTTTAEVTEDGKSLSSTSVEAVTDKPTTKQIKVQQQDSNSIIAENGSVTSLTQQDSVETEASVTKQCNNSGSSQQPLQNVAKTIWHHDNSVGFSSEKRISTNKLIDKLNQESYELILNGEENGQLSPDSAQFPLSEAINTRAINASKTSGVDTNEISNGKLVHLEKAIDISKHNSVDYVTQQSTSIESKRFLEPNSNSVQNYPTYNLKTRQEKGSTQTQTPVEWSPPVIVATIPKLCSTMHNNCNKNLHKKLSNTSHSGSLNCSDNIINAKDNLSNLVNSTHSNNNQNGIPTSTINAIEHQSTKLSTDLTEENMNSIRHVTKTDSKTTEDNRGTNESSISNNDPSNSLKALEENLSKHAIANLEIINVHRMEKDARHINNVHVDSKTNPNLEANESLSTTNKHLVSNRILSITQEKHNIANQNMTNQRIAANTSPSGVRDCHTTIDNDSYCPENADFQSLDDIDVDSKSTKSNNASPESTDLNSLDDHSRPTKSHRGTDADWGEMPSLAIDLSSPEEVTAIVSDDSDGQCEDEWEDEDDEDIYKVLRKNVCADITSLIVTRSLVAEKSTRTAATPNLCDGKQETAAMRNIEAEIPDVIGRTTNGREMASDPTENLKEQIGLANVITPNNENGVNWSVKCSSVTTRSVSRESITLPAKPHQILKTTSSHQLMNNINNSEDTSEQNISTTRSASHGDLVNGNHSRNISENITNDSVIENQSGEDETIKCGDRIKLFEQMLQRKNRTNNLNRDRRIENKTINESSVYSQNEVRQHCVEKSNIESNNNTSDNPVTEMVTTGSVETAADDRIKIADNNSDPERDNSYNSSSTNIPDSSEQKWPDIDLASRISPPNTSKSGGGGQLVVLLLKPSIRQQAWQFSSAHLKVWYDRDAESSSSEARRPPQRTRLTYHARPPRSRQQ